jgi:hypothetical protein
MQTKANRSPTQTTALQAGSFAVGRETARLAQLRALAEASPSVGGLAALQATADKSGPLQRYPASNGVLGAWTLNAGTFLTHGTAVRQFLDPANAPQPLPDAPAWFAMGSRFSAHAGARGGNAVTHLHNYEVTANMNLLAFADVNDISLYLQANGHAATNVNGTAEALIILGLNGGAVGYYVQADAVRGEPEIILFAGGMANLASRFRAELESEEPPDFKDDMAIGGRRKLKGGDRVLHTANVDDLVDFRTEGDRGGGRARSSSF